MPRDKNKKKEEKIERVKEKVIVEPKLKPGFEKREWEAS